jgi:hypothetical protein
MVNAGMVNTRTSPNFYRIFARFLLCFTWFLLFENSVKYDQIFCINGCRRPAPPPRHTTAAYFSGYLNTLCP